MRLSNASNGPSIALGTIVDGTLNSYLIRVYRCACDVREVNSLHLKGLTSTNVPEMVFDDHDDKHDSSFGEADANIGDAVGHAQHEFRQWNCPQLMS